MLGRLARTTYTLATSQRCFGRITRAFASSNGDQDGHDNSAKSGEPVQQQPPKARIFGNLQKDSKNQKDQSKKPQEDAVAAAPKGKFFRFQAPAAEESQKEPQKETKQTQKPAEKSQTKVSQPDQPRIAYQPKVRFIDIDFRGLEKQALTTVADSLPSSLYYQKYLSKTFESETEMIQLLDLGNTPTENLNGKAILAAIKHKLFGEVQLDGKTLKSRVALEDSDIEAFRDPEIKLNQASKESESLENAQKRVQQSLQQFASQVGLKKYSIGEEMAGSTANKQLLLNLLERKQKGGHAASKLLEEHAARIEKEASANPGSLKNFKRAKSLVNDLLKQKQADDKGLQAINYHTMHPEEQVKLTKALEEFRKNRLDRHKQILGSMTKGQRDNLDPERKYLAHREFFDQIKNLMDYLKLHKPELFDTIKESDFFSKFNPTKITPDMFNFPLYPGSLKGLRPEDDPEYFLNWLQASCPEPLQEAMEHLNALLNPKESNEGEAEEDIEEVIFQDFSLKGHQNYAAADLAMESNKLEDVMSQNMNEHISDLYDTENSSVTIMDAPSAPWEFFHSAMPFTEQEFLNSFDKWNNFAFLGAMEGLIREYEVKRKTGTLPEYKTPTLELTDAYYPTVMPYLELFPAYLRENKMIRSVALLIDKKWFNVPLIEKQEMLNFAVSLVLPPEDWLKKMGEIILEETPAPSAKEILETLLLDEKQFHEGGGFDQFKPTTEDLIKIRSTVDKVEGQFLQKPKPLEDTSPHIPDAYYDNEDGFWDDFVQKRNERRAKLPLLKSGTHYRH